MHEAASTPTVHEVLLALEELLTHETQALIRLDPEAVEATSKRKLVLTESLAAFGPIVLEGRTVAAHQDTNENSKQSRSIGRRPASTST